MTRLLLLTKLYLLAFALLAWIVLPLDAWQESPQSTAPQAVASAQSATTSPIATAQNRISGVAIRLYKLNEITLSEG